MVPEPSSDAQIYRNNLMENVGTSAGPKGSYLRVRALTDSDCDATDTDFSDDRDALGVTIEVDLVDPEDPSEPDFALGAHKLLVQPLLVTGFGSADEAVAHFGLGDRGQRVWVRTFFPGGEEVRMMVDVDRFHTRSPKRWRGA